MTDHPLDSIRNIAEAFYVTAADYPERVVYSQAVFDTDAPSSEPRAWISTDYATVKARINKIAHYLKSVGVAKGVKVGIISNSRPEWLEADIAVLSLGGVVVSIYQSLPPSDIAYILFDSGAKIVFAENQEQVNKLKEIASKEWKMPATEERGESLERVEVERIIAFEQCALDDSVVQLEEILTGPERQEPSEMLKIRRTDIASLVYTSGTTGPPKGVIQSHHNHLSNVRQAVETGLFEPESSFMLFLPLAHSFAKLIGYLGFLTPASLKFPAVADTRTSKLQPSSITRDIREGSASIVPVVPRLLEKMRAGVLLKAEGGGVGGFLLRLAINAALKVQSGKGGVIDRAVYSATAFMRRKVKEKLFGPNFCFCISGGAKLPPNVGRFFDALGITVLEGYGLTETCVATNINRLGANKIGTVGPVLSEDIELKIADDGEIMFRGPNVALGYHNRPQATRKAWDSRGWFHTGDLGSVDEDGYLTITGRKKEILVSSTGKNIAPQDIEAAVKESRYISQVVMVGDGRPYCTALITLDMDAVGEWCRANGVIPAGHYSSDPKVYDLVWGEVQRVNASLAGFEQIKKIEIVPDDFTVENGFLTPTFKVKRDLVLKEYGDLVERMYSSR
ncbi:MAG: long-chain fatty acid--CoA ligase [Candidatus Dadabacteria bacterium]|nr:MAG: long-chain fatty acid--CoA ligase [Candidatus Dadabacteria bacterium]